MNDLVHTTLSHIARISSGTTPSRSTPDYYDPNGHNWVKTGDLNNSIVDVTEERISHWALEKTSCRLFPVGTVLVAMYGGFNQIGRTGILGNPAAVNQAISALVVDQSQADPQYVLHYLNYRVDYWRKVAASSRKDPNITRSDVEDFPITLLPLPEQRTVAEILSTWDHARYEQGRLISVKTRFLRMMKELLTTHPRLERDEWTSWPAVSLADVTSPVSHRNGSRYGEERVMAVTKAEGMVPMRDYVRADDISRYKIVPANGFAYNPMRLNIGSIAKNEHGQEVLVSPDYVVFIAKPEVLDHRYLDHLRRTSVWSQFVENAGNGSVRVRIYYDDLANLAFRLPPLEEQQAIATVLDTVQQEITLLERKRSAIEKQKRGLMQQLLTGALRVKPN